jgi:hypothetical protein
VNANAGVVSTDPCLACGSAQELISHHVASKAIAPDATVTLCRTCHVRLHAQHSRLWRAPLWPTPVEVARLGLLRLAETVDLLTTAAPVLSEALDRIAELLLDERHHVVILWTATGSWV